MDRPDPPHPAIRVIWPDADIDADANAGTIAPPYPGPCPNCAAAGPKPHLLDVAWTAPKLEGGDRKPVFACPTCDARFYPPLAVPNYHDPDVMEWGWHQFHIQQGAGLVPITETIGRIARPPGTRCLEIGCGYGFGLDFAIHALGWHGMGIDPSPMARLGAADLGITINDGYFPQADPEATLWDVIAATEVIEHVETPADLLAAIRTRLAPGGILLLTTPDGAAITRETPEAALVQLLAPGIHMVFQTEASLRRLLDRAGFPSAAIGRDGLTLVAYAQLISVGTLNAGTIENALNHDDALQRQRFRAYLTARAAAIPPITDLGLGFAGRALFEAAVDLDWPAAKAARDHLFPAIKTRFDLDLDRIDAIPPRFAALSLAALKDCMPLNLGMILYAEASRLRADPATRPRAAPLFLLASAAAATLHAALARLSLNDGLAEELSWRGIAEAAIEAARTGDAAALPRFASLRDLEGATAERAGIVWRGVIELTNAGATDLARTLLAREHLTVPPPDLPPDLRRDAIIVLGQLALAPDGDPLAAIAMAAALGPADPAYETLLGGGFVRLVNRARYTEALPHVPQVTATCITGASAAATDALNALAIAIERAADPAAIPSLLRPLPLDPLRRDAILLDAFCRLVDAGRYDAAITMADDENIVSRAVARDDAAGNDARLALALLDLATGDPMDVPARLTGLAIDDQRRRDILIGAFSRLVNAARYRDAQNFATAHSIETLAAPPVHGEHHKSGIDATIGLAILDLVLGDPAAAPARIATIPLDAERRRQITLGAFVTLVNRARYDDATTLRATTPIDAWANTEADADGTDARHAIAVLDLVRGDPVHLPALIATLDILPQDIPPLAINGFSKLVNAGRYAEAVALATALRLEPTDPALTETQRADLWLGRTVIELAIGDAALVEPHLRNFDLPAAERAVLLLSAFVRLVNDSNYAGAVALAERHPPQRLIPLVAGALATDAMVALALVELAVGDPATVPSLIAGFPIPAAKSNELIATSFIRLINADRHDDAAAIAARHDIAAIATALTGALNSALGADLSLCRARFDLVRGDPQAAPARLIGYDIPPPNRAEIILGTLIRLVNRADYQAARTLLAEFDIADLIAIATTDDRNDAIQALIALELAAGDPGRIIEMLTRFPTLPMQAQDIARAEAFVRLMNAGRFDDANAIATTGGWLDRLDHIGGKRAADCQRGLIQLDLRHADTLVNIPARVAALIALDGSAAEVQPLIEAGFIAAVARGDRALAARLHPSLTRQPGPFATAHTPADRSFFYAYGVFLLGAAPPQPHRAEIAFSAVRRGTVATLEPGDQADTVFWESVRGEMIALHATDRAAEAQALGQMMQSRYQGSPADLLNTQTAAIQDHD